MLFSNTYRFLCLKKMNRIKLFSRKKNKQLTEKEEQKLAHLLTFGSLAFSRFIGHIFQGKKEATFDGLLFM